MKDILEKTSNNDPKRNATDQKIGDFYSACMDENAVNQKGALPLKADFNRINAMKSKNDILSELIDLHSKGVNSFFSFGSDQDFKDASQVIAEIDQGGLTLPDRDYYLRSDEKSAKTREQYVAHVNSMFKLLGDAPAKAAEEAKAVMNIETELAKGSLDRVSRRDPQKLYHKLPAKELVTLLPNFAWDKYCQGVGAPGTINSRNVVHPEYLQTMNTVIDNSNLDDLKTYLRWHLLNARARALPRKFVEEDFDFNNRILTGTKEPLPRWKRCVAATDNALGEALGQVYVQKHFPPTAKARAMQMVQNLISALRDDLATLSWMDDTTRKRATAKLEAFTRKIGYPDQWRDYATLKVSRNSYAENLANAQRFETNRQLTKIAKPVNRGEWGMSPPTVNAYYNPSLNEIVFPAGILQPPFYDPAADDAINYGGIGAVIGHEMSHGFDDSGAKFDAEGNLANWWSDADLKSFKERAQCVIDQFSGFEVQPGLHQNGNLVVGESIGDLGGLTIAYAAFKKSLEGKPRPAEIDGFTPEQRFFLGWAQVWAQNLRPEYERLLVNTDPHPVGRFRVIGPLSNMPAFAEAYQCKAGDAMVRPPEKRCQIW